MKKPVEIFKKLQWWLSDRFDGPFTDMGCSMEHGKQNDGISCAITTANMISHAALGEPLWNVSRAIHERVIWFNKIVATHNKCVSTKIRLGE